MFFAPSKSRQRAKIQTMSVSQTNDHIQIKIKMLNPSHAQPAPTKPQIRSYKTWIFFALSKSRQRAEIQIMSLSKTSDHIQIKIKMPNPSQEPPASSKAPGQDLKDMDVLCTFKIKIESQNLDHQYIRDLSSYANKDQDAKPQSGTSSILQSPK